MRRGWAVAKWGRREYGAAPVNGWLTPPGARASHFFAKGADSSVCNGWWYSPRDGRPGPVAERKPCKACAPILRSLPLLNCLLSLGTWWDAHHGAGAQAVQPESTEGAEQARLF